jgi:hypothetical protein
VRSAGAHPGWSRPCAHGCGLGSPAAWLRSSLRSTPFGTARRRPAAPRRSTCRRAHVTLNGTGWPRAHSQRPGVYANAARGCLANRWRAGIGRRIGGGVDRNLCTFGRRGRLAGYGLEWHHVIGLLGADFVEDSLAASQLGFATGDARHILGCHLGAAYDAERGQHNEDRSTAPAANKR